MEVTRKKMGDLFEIKAGGTPSRARADYYGGKIPWVKISDMLQGRITHTEEYISELGLENSGAKLLPKGTLLISIFATVGRTAELDIDATTNQAIVGLVPKSNGFDKKFIRFYLDSQVKKLIEMSRGVAQNNINKSILSDIEIPLPDIKTQQKIASILEQADAARQKRKQANKLTEQFLQSIFLEIFGDPVRNEKGWEIKRLEEVSNKITDGVHAKPVYVERGIPFISVKDITSGQLIFEKCKFISKEAHQEYTRRCKPEFGDVLYTKVGATYGRPAIVATHEEFSLYVSVALIKPKSGEVNPLYLREFLRSDYAKWQADHAISGIGVPDLHLIEIKNFKIPIPPISLQKKFSNIVDQVEQLRSKQRESEKELENLFNSLMQRYFG